MEENLKKKQRNEKARQDKSTFLKGKGSAGVSAGGAEEPPPPANPAAARGKKRPLGAAAEVLEKKHNISDFASAKALLPPTGAGTGLYKAKDGRWKIQMPNLAHDGLRTRSFSSSWCVRSDTESWKFLLAEAWHFYKTNGGEAEAPSL